MGTGARRSERVDVSVDPGNNSTEDLELVSPKRLCYHQDPLQRVSTKSFVSKHTRKKVLLELNLDHVTKLARKEGEAQSQPIEMERLCRQSKAAIHHRMLKGFNCEAKPMDQDGKAFSVKQSQSTKLKGVVKQRSCKIERLSASQSQSASDDGKAV